MIKLLRKWLAPDREQTYYNHSGEVRTARDIKRSLAELNKYEAVQRRGFGYFAIADRGNRYMIWPEIQEKSIPASWRKLEL